MDGRVDRPDRTRKKKNQNWQMDSKVWRRRRPLERRAGGQVLCIEGVVQE